MANRQSKKIRESLGDRIFMAIIYTLLALITIMMLYPILYTLSASVSDPVAVNSGELILLPKGFQIEGYQLIFENEWILTGYRNSLFYTVFGTIINLVVTYMAAYALSRRHLYGKGLLSTIFIIPMWFGGGLIPTFLVVMRIGLFNKPYTMLLLGAISIYNMVICRTFLQQLPEELSDAARIDGCNDFGIMTRILLPLSTPILAVLSLYYGMGHWNDYFNSMIYLNNREYMPLQLFLREILLMNAQVDMTGTVEELQDMAFRAYISQTMRYGLIVVASIPMLILYPFVQRFFVQGVMIGALKG